MELGLAAWAAVRTYIADGPVSDVTETRQGNIRPTAVRKLAPMPPTVVR
jgi:hypothetical protein